jgi:hypothetical protein
MTLRLGPSLNWENGEWRIENETVALQFFILHSLFSISSLAIIFAP